ncbi:VOC family protein [Oceanispirochaeta crateris]|uniref:VOC family protein n=1 Tax=Oceanispirochaeta crateris TaxID=2518645 RepID=A0A5C1QJK1_9SPIO|nr:VOC family protein [Oceanispirochaeta crateris]QEN07170.1 VOC family protein [Oceanispirochaeta crateris]
MMNPVHWFEIPTTDIERANAFYKKVFNLKTQLIEMPWSKMYIFGDPEGVGSSGSLVESSEQNKPTTDGSVIYFSCEDISNELKLAEKEGGKILLPKTDIGDFGFFAQIVDTEGNRIGLHSNK